MKQPLLFDQKLAEHIATLAKLDPSHPALASIVDDMQHILAMVQVMDEVDTTDVIPLRHPLALPHILREDSTQAADTPRLLSNAPASEEGYFLVPQVIE